MISGSTKASASAKRSRRICVSSFRAWATMRLIILHSQLFPVSGLGVGGCNDVEGIAEKAHTPALFLRLQQIRGALWLIDDELEKVPALLPFHAARRTFGDQFSGYHETQPVTLLGLFEIVRSDQNRGAQIGKAIDHAHERAARQRIHARSGPAHTPATTVRLVSGCRATS